MPTTQSNTIDLGKRIRELRTNLGCSQEEIARQLHIPRPSVSQIEHNERDISALELSELSRIFQMSMDEIIGTKPPKNQPARKPYDKIIYIIRHGEAIDDLYNEYGGWADPDLSARGVHSAYTVAQNLRKQDLSFDIIYTSPLKRARQKAEILGRELATNVKILQYLKERNTYGLLCGINKDIARKRFPELVAAYDNKDYVLGSERYADFVSRLQLLFEYLNASTYRHIACITHGKIMSAIIEEYLHMKPDEMDEGCIFVIGMNTGNMFYVKSEGITYTY